MIGKGNNRKITLDLLGAIAGALKAAGNAPKTLATVRELIGQDEHPTHQGANTMTEQAMQDVIAERRRQMTVEGWVSQHDDEHIDGSLAAVAACYALHAYNESAIQSGYIPWRNQALDGDPEHWPYSWDTSWWKPKDRRRNLVRAAALLIAEIERLDRAIKEPTP